MKELFIQIATYPLETGMVVFAVIVLGIAGYIYSSLLWLSSKG